MEETQGLQTPRDMLQLSITLAFSLSYITLLVIVS